MAQIIHQFSVVIPAGTAIDDPFSESLNLPQELNLSVDLEVPPGPAGLMGFYLAVSGQQIIPFEMGEFIVWDNQFRSWDLENFATTGAWSLVGYNLDSVNDHMVTVRFHDNPLSSPGAQTPSISIINGVADEYLVTL